MYSELIRAFCWKQLPLETTLIAVRVKVLAVKPKQPETLHTAEANLQSQVLILCGAVCSDPFHIMQSFDQLLTYKY